MTELDGRNVSQDIDTSTVDVKKLVLFDGFRTAVVKPEDEDLALGLEMNGRLNGTQDRVRVTYLVHPVEAAQLVAHLIDLASSTELAEEFQKALEAALHGLRLNGGS